MPTPFAAANWKMHMTVAESVALAERVRGGLAQITGATRVVCPPFTALAAVAAALDGSGVGVGAQNMHPEASGAFTGEVSGAMVRDLCGYVIVGHSERRHLFGETDEFVNQKVRAALELGLTPIFCLGETLEQREAGQAAAVCREQLRRGLDGLDAEAVAHVVVAYEPVWAIGTGRAATPAVAQEMMGGLRRELGELAGAAAAEMPLLYGGSVNPDNIASFAAEADVDGALVGGASLRADQFIAIAAAVAQAGAAS